MLTGRAPEGLDELQPQDLWQVIFPEHPTAPGGESNLDVHVFLRDLATIRQFGVAVPGAGIDLGPRDLGSPEYTWLRRRWPAPTPAVTGAWVTGDSEPGLGPTAAGLSGVDTERP